jgi:uncharacterized protein YhaN
MRILSLDLDRYGPFTGQRLTFREDARLHLVFGPNEAGKSCALAAVTDLLFGIERDTRFDFLHAGKELRIGATIRDRAGRELAFRRRKTKPMLTDAAEVPLADDALAPYLGSLSREVFRRAFGLDAVALRQSGDELKRSDGELGAALFSAASGLRGFADAKAALERDAERIFAKTRSQTRVFYQAADRYETARKLLRDHETRAGALKALRQGLEDNERRFAEIRALRSTLMAERARMERLGRAAPVIGAIDALQARLGDLGALPSAPDGSGDALIDAIAAATTATLAQETAVAHVHRVEGDLAAIAVDDALLGKADAVEALTPDLGAYQKALRDLPGVMREEDEVTRSLADLATRLQMADVATLLARQPDDASRARVADLVASGKRLELALLARRTDAGREQEALANMRRERDRRGALVDPRPFRERMATLADVRKLAEQAGVEAAAIAVETAALSEAAGRLSPAVSDIDVLARSPMPSRETIAAFQARLSDLDQADRSARQARAAAQQEIALLTSTLAELAAGGAVPTAERIAILRGERDRYWVTLSAALFGGADAMGGAALAENVARFEAAKAEADRLADAAVLDAKRVASHADATRRLAAQEAVAAGIEARCAELAQERDVALRDWQSAWAPAGLVPLAPAEMATWRLQVDGLMERRARLQERRARTEHAVRQVAAAEPALAELVAGLGLSAMPGLAIETTARRIEAEIARIAELWEAARDSDTLMADLELRAAAATAAVQTAQVDAADWAAEFRAALPRIGLPETATIAEAEIVLAAWKEVPVVVGQRDGLQRRIAGMQRDAAVFQQAVRALAAAVAPDLADAEPPAALRTLNQRLKEARDARTRRQGVSRRLDEARKEAAQADDKRTAADRAVAALAGRVGLTVDATLEEVARRLAERDAIVVTLALRRDELANAADGRAEAVLRDALSTYEAETAEGELRRLADDEQALEREAQEVFAACKQARDRLTSLEGAVEAEVALQQRRGAEAEMLEAAREWAVRSVGALMMGTAMTRQRLGRQEPLMVRAGELFCVLTGGAFAGLAQSFDDDEAPHLVGRRAGGAEAGAEVGVMGMSEGTRDQLYLALRLAYLEDYAARVEPAPFLGDDLFASFDDARTGHGLEALAAIGAAVQPIVFTHHRFVVDAARRQLGDGVDVVELG